MDPTLTDPPTRAMERLLEEVSFDATRLADRNVTIDGAYVDARLKDLSRNEDLSRYIL